MIIVSIEMKRTTIGGDDKNIFLKRQDEMTTKFFENPHKNDNLRIDNI